MWAPRCSRWSPMSTFRWTSTSGSNRRKRKSMELVNGTYAILDDTALQQKAQLTTQAVDMLMSQGTVGQMVASMGQMVGIPEVSISLIFPTKKPHNMRPFLASLNSIISTALDDQADLSDFTQKLAEAIREIQRIAAEENA